MVSCHHPHSYPPSQPPFSDSHHLPPCHLRPCHRHRPFPYPDCRPNRYHTVSPHHPPWAYAHQNHVVSFICCLTPRKNLYYHLRKLTQWVLRPALNILVLVSSLCPILLASCSNCTALRAFSPCGLFSNIFNFPCPCIFQFPFPFPTSVACPFSFLSSIAFRFPFPFSVPLLPPGAFSPPCVSSLPLTSALLLPSPERLLPPLGIPGSSQISSSSSLSIISSQFRGRMTSKSPGLYHRQLGGSNFGLGSSQPYQQKRSGVRLTFPDLVISGLEWSTSSLKARWLCHN